MLTAILELDAEAIGRLADAIAARLQPPESDEADAWLDTRRAASYAGCTVTALHKATSGRQVRFEQDGPRGKCWFKREWIDAWRSSADASMPLPRGRDAA